MSQMEKIAPKQFFLNVLNAMAIGVVAALIANAAIGGLLKFFLGMLEQGSVIHTLLSNLTWSATLIQFGTCPLIGFLAARSFNFSPLQCATVMLVAFVTSGSIVSVPGTGIMVKGLGDILNVLFSVSVACWATMAIGNKFGSLTIVLNPIVIAVGVSTLGLFTLPYISSVTKSFGEMINSFTNLQPILMCGLISMAFCFAVSSPLSSVALGLITGITGLASGAANVGVATAATFLIVSGWRSNSIGVPIAIFFGAIKMQLPNLLKKPVMFVPMLAQAFINGAVMSFLGVVGTAKTAGFGYISFIGPIESYSQMTTTGGLGSTTAMIYLLIAYLVVPFTLAIVSHITLSKMGIYSSEDLRFSSNN